MLLAISLSLSSNIPFLYKSSLTIFSYYLYLKQNEIADVVNVSPQYISKTIKEDERYEQEKNSRKSIQEWLGHSNFSTTANLYAHLDTNSKKVSASVIEDTFKLTDTKKENEESNSSSSNNN